MFPADTQLAILSTVAWPKALCPTHTAGADSQRPMHGTPTTRTSGPSAFGSLSRSAFAPAIWHDSVSQTRTVTGGGGDSLVSTMSKW